MEITISKACIFKDGRCHAVYTDGSGIILHSGGHYSTYFSPSGEIQRNLTLCTVSGVKSKILKLIKLCNSSLASPISIFSEEIYKVSTHEAKIQSATFKNPGHLKLSEEQESSSEAPSKSSFLFIIQDSKASLNPLKNLFKVTFPLLLPHRKPTWTENRASRVRLTYEYVTLTQIFHIFNIPETWSPLTSLLLSAESQEIPDFFLSSTIDEFQITLPTSSSGTVWSSDSVSPAVSLFSYFGANLVWTWTPEATSYISSSLSSLTVIHEDQSLLEASGDFFTHIRDENSIKFTAETVPPNVRSGCYKLHKFVKDIREFQTLPEVVPKPSLLEEDAEFLEGVKFENEVEGIGSFIAYNDRSIRVLFDDRTCVRVYSDFSVSAISRTGESARFTLENPYGFESYIPVCVEFYNWAFLTASEQNKRLQETAEREAIVQAELSKNERLSYKLPLASSHSSELQPLPDNISQSLMAAEKQLQETRDLLNKLNLNKE